MTLGLSGAFSGSSAARISEASISGRKLKSWFTDDKNAAAYVQPGDTGIGQAINRAILDAGVSGCIKVPPGTYASPGDILIKQAGRTNGFFALDMRGVAFLGPGTIVLDSCKNVHIIGLDARGYTLSLRGSWNGRFADCGFDVIAFGDVAGTDYSQSYWNTFDNTTQSVVRFFAEANANTFRAPRFRGDAQQGLPTARDYAFEFNANSNVQTLHVIGGDVSYYAQGLYTIGPANVAGDIDLTIEGGTYFDTLAPLPTAARPNVRVVTKGIYVATPKGLAAAGLAAATKDDQDAWSGTISSGWRAFADVNFIPNGDLSVGRSSYANLAGRVVSNANGAVVTEQAGGVNGRYLNINQGTNNIVYITSDALPVNGQYSGGLWLRSGGGVGTSVLQVGFAAQYVTATLGPDWSFISFSPTLQMAAGSTFLISFNVGGNGPFNIDLMYAGVTLGIRPPLWSRSKATSTQENSNTINPGAIAAGPTYGPTSYISGFIGLSRGDFIEATYDQPLQGMQLVADIISDTQVTVQFYNPSGNASKTIASGTMRARVRSRLP